MAQQTINIGTIPNDNTGDTPRVAGDKINDNFTELYAKDADLETRVTDLEGNTIDAADVSVDAHAGLTDNASTLDVALKNLSEVVAKDIELDTTPFTGVSGNLGAGVDTVQKLANYIHTATFGGGGGGATTVVDNLSTNSATSALSAAQGVVLKAAIDATTALASINATGFDGNLATSDNTLQKVAQKFDDYVPTAAATTVDTTNFGGTTNFPTTLDTVQKVLDFLNTRNSGDSLNNTGLDNAANDGLFAGQTFTDAQEFMDYVDDWSVHTQAMGISSAARHFGTFTGNILPDDADAKTLFQTLEAEIEGGLTWDPTKTYAIDDPVFRNGRLYYAVAASTTIDPATDTSETTWRLGTQVEGLKGYLDTLGKVKTGLIVSSPGALQLEVSGGTLAGLVGNDILVQNQLATSPLVFDVYDRNGLVNAAQISVPVTQYDDGGTLTALPAGNDATIHHVLTDGNGNFAVVIGQTFYGTLNTAKANFDSDTIVVPAALNGYTSLARIAARRDATDLNVDTRAEFLNTSKFAETFGGGGGGTLPANAPGKLTNDGAGNLTWDLSADAFFGDVANSTDRLSLPDIPGQYGFQTDNDKYMFVQRKSPSNTASSWERIVLALENQFQNDTTSSMNDTNNFMNQST